MKKFFTLLLPLLLTTLLHAQVVTINPPFATQSDVVTVTFDATLGNGALVGVNQVYAHTGVITNNSTGPSDWQHVVGNWGTADPVVQMTNIGNNKHTIVIDITQFYGVPTGETVQELAFVFRNADGSVVGRASDGSDIFVPIFAGGFNGSITLPAQPPIVVGTDVVQVEMQTSSNAEIKLFHDGTQIAIEPNGTSLNHSFTASTYGPGKFELVMTADNGSNVITDTTYYIMRGAVQIGNTPSGVVDGINYTSPTSVTLQLHAPFKDYVYVVGDFNNWEADPNYYMTQTPDGARWWLEINNLNPGQEYAFQYQIGDEKLRVGDVYSDKVLDPWNDQYIPASVYPNLKAYPTGKTTNMVSILQTDQTPYAWDPSVNYARPDQENLVIYELLVRDFEATHSWETLIDTLDYLENLGINAIQLMPIMEFEGNESWGYNPAFFFAPDKYYGTKDKFKEFVEEAHRRDIAILLDIALNHSFGQNPQVRMYFDANAGQFGQPTSQSPWFHETARHDFNVGYDYDHEAQATKDFVDRVVTYWIQEYQVDGYRFDLSKGFTNNVTIGNIGAWNAYDQSRINLWKRISDVIRNVDPTSILILEHFSDNSEETELSNYGFMLWGNMNHEYNEATMGYSSNLFGVTHHSRGWNDKHLVGFMESHDEQRLMYKNLQFGNSNGGYDITNEATGLSRLELAANFFFPIPGPKMLWQFGEVGYDFPINYCPDGTIDPGCRTSNKPIRWDYFQEANRIRVYKVFGALNQLKITEPAFTSNDFNYILDQPMKRLRINHASMNVDVLGNFNVTAGDITPSFQHTGWWYEYFTGDSIDVTDTEAPINLQPGEYRFYTDVKLTTPELTVSAEEIGLPAGERLEPMAYPNPFSDQITLAYPVEEAGNVTITVYDLLGQEVTRLVDRNHQQGYYSIRWDGTSASGESLPNGYYLFTVQIDGEVFSGKMAINR